MGPGSAEQRQARSTASGTRVAARMKPTGRANARPMINSAKSRVASLISWLRLFDGSKPAKRRSIRATGLRANGELLNGINLICPVQTHFQKYFPSRRTQITSISLAIPSHTEGRIAIVTDVGGGMRWTQAALLTRARTCGRRSRVDYILVFGETRRS
jgi:hypothetical protein